MPAASSRSMYKNRKARATAGKIIPTTGTRIEGKNEAAIANFLSK
jgi:hypothetical protein